MRDNLLKCQQNSCSHIFRQSQGVQKETIPGKDPWEDARGVTQKLSCPKCGCTSFWQVKVSGVAVR